MSQFHPCWREREKGKVREMEDRNGKGPETNSPPGRDLTRTTLAVLWIGIVIVANFWVLRPFLPSLLWAVMIVVATWPLMLGVQARLWGRRGLAVAVMTLALLLVLVVPLSLAVGTIVGNADRIADWAKSLRTLALSAPPEWIARIPMAGPKLSAAWQEIAQRMAHEIKNPLTPIKLAAERLVRKYMAAPEPLRDGEFGKIRIFEEEERKEIKGQEHDFTFNN